MSSQLITPSKLSLFSISPAIGTWWQELEARRLFDGSKPAVRDLDQKLFADGLRHKQVLIKKIEKKGHRIANISAEVEQINWFCRMTCVAGVEL